MSRSHASQPGPVPRLQAAPGNGPPRDGYTTVSDNSRPAYQRYIERRVSQAETGPQPQSQTRQRLSIGGPDSSGRPAAGSNRSIRVLSVSTPPAADPPWRRSSKDDSRPTSSLSLGSAPAAAGSPLDRASLDRRRRVLYGAVDKLLGARSSLSHEAPRATASRPSATAPEPRLGSTAAVPRSTPRASISAGDSPGARQPRASRFAAAAPNDPARHAAAAAPLPEVRRQPVVAVVEVEVKAVTPPRPERPRLALRHVQAEAPRPALPPPPISWSAVLEDGGLRRDRKSPVRRRPSAPQSRDDSANDGLSGSSPHGGWGPAFVDTSRDTGASSWPRRLSQASGDGANTPRMSSMVTSPSITPMRSSVGLRPAVWTPNSQIPLLVATLPRAPSPGQYRLLDDDFYDRQRARLAPTPASRALSINGAPMDSSLQPAPRRLLPSGPATLAREPMVMTADDLAMLAFQRKLEAERERLQMEMRHRSKRR